MQSRSLLVLAWLALAAAPALAQSSASINVTGTIARIDAGSVVLQREGGGAEETYRLAPNLLVVQSKPATLADIRPDDFVASAAMRGTDGKLHSTELRIFPAAMRGLGEGQRPMNDPRGQTMTNATVTGTAVANGSNDLKVRFADRESELVVDPGVPVTRIDTADRALLVPGAKVRLQGTRGAEGATIGRIALQ